MILGRRKSSRLICLGGSDSQREGGWKRRLVGLERWREWIEFLVGGRPLLFFWMACVSFESREVNRSLAFWGFLLCATWDLCWDGFDWSLSTAYLLECMSIWKLIFVCFNNCILNWIVEFLSYYLSKIVAANWIGRGANWPYAAWCILWYYRQSQPTCNITGYETALLSDL